MTSDGIDPEDHILMFITESGFKLVSAQAIIDALAEMEEYLKSTLNISQEELDNYLEKLENLLGKEEVMHFDLDEIVSWVQAMRGF